MKEKDYTITFNCPDIEDFREIYPRYARMIENDKANLWNLVMSGQSYIKCCVAADFGLPAVTGVADDYVKLVNKNVLLIDKQILGAIVAVLMIFNGYTKTDKKRSVSNDYFTKGTVFEK